MELRYCPRTTPPLTTPGAAAHLGWISFKSKFPAATKKKEEKKRCSAHQLELGYNVFTPLHLSALGYNLAPVPACSHSSLAEWLRPRLASIRQTQPYYSSTVLISLFVGHPSLFHRCLGLARPFILYLSPTAAPSASLLGRSSKIISTLNHASNLNLLRKEASFMFI